MAKDKERLFNPVQAQRKLEKQKALKKGKAEVQARRNEKLARRNPERLQRQIDELKSIEESGQPLRPHQKQTLENLERDLRAVKKAREALGDRAPAFEKGRGYDRDRGDDVLGKRRREAHDRRGQRSRQDDSSDTDESVRRIPMPRDTPPPIPRQQHRRQAQADQEGGERPVHSLPPKPEIKTVYEAAPEIRNLRQEAVSKFVPAVVRTKQAAVKGQGRLVEPEEMDKLEQAGYTPAGATGGTTTSTSQPAEPEASSIDLDAARLAEEEARFERELRTVQIEEVTDEEL